MTEPATGSATGSATGPVSGWLAPVTLAGTHVRLRPLERDDAPALVAAATDGALWSNWYTAVPEPDGMAAEIDRRLALQAAGSMLPFTVERLPDRRVVGMTSFMDIDHANRRLEIGSTWYAAGAQRTGLNTDGKRLLLAHAFERLDCIAVTFLTHVLNRASRQAIERLGARFDGVLRAHRLWRDGTIRDSAVYSITAAEWPSVRAHLDALLRARAHAG